MNQFQNLLLEIRQHLSLQLDRPMAEISMGDRLIEDLGMDSLELAEVLVMLETRHGISLSVQAVARLNTVAALAGEAAACIAS